KKLLPETMGAGVAFLDYDNDGRPDLLFVNSCPWPGREEAGRPAPTLALYRNRGGGRFEDVTRDAGLALTLYGIGVSAGDYDNDGLLDLFVCNYVSWSPAADLDQGFKLVGVGRAFGPPTAFDGTHCFLYRNLGGGRFEDVSGPAGVRVFDQEGTGEGARPRP